MPRYLPSCIYYKSVENWYGCRDRKFLRRQEFSLIKSSSGILCWQPNPNSHGAFLVMMMEFEAKRKAAHVRVLEIAKIVRRQRHCSNAQLHANCAAIHGEPTFDMPPEQFSLHFSSYCLRAKPSS